LDPDPRHLDTDTLPLDKVEDLKGVEVLDAINGVSSLSTKGEDASGSQDPQVLGDVGLFEVQFFPDIGNTAALLVQKLKDPDSRRVSQGL
jgi:hypothetical protein